MPAAELPPIMQERIVCSISASIKYQVPANILLAVAEKEGGKVGQYVTNRNGTFDVGPMQFNTSYLSELKHYGITAQDVAASGCYPYDLAAWRLRLHIKNDKGDIWTRAANYHSKTPHYNAVYRSDLIIKASKWSYWLESRYLTFDVISGTTHQTSTNEPTTNITPQKVSYTPRKIYASGENWTPERTTK